LPEPREPNLATFAAGRAPSSTPPGRTELEVVGEHDRSVPPGVPGRKVLLTNRGNKASRCCATS
jgi:hypothetical protein